MIIQLKIEISSAQEEAANSNRFLSLVRRYADIKKLTTEILREFVERVYVHIKLSILTVKKPENTNHLQLYFWGNPLIKIRKKQHSR